jgi:hypothetical protein
LSRPIRIGEILIEQGVLSEQQVFEIVEAQRRLKLPFGVVAEQLFEVSLDSIEAAWAEQYYRFTGTVDLADQSFDESAQQLIGRRQAWQFELLPIGFDETGELVIAASRRRLARAVTYAASRIEHMVFFRIAEPKQLRHYLRHYYPMPEAPPRLMDKMRAVPTQPPLPS